MSVPLNTLGVVKRTIERTDPAIVEKLSQFGVATIHEAMGRVGLLKPYIRPIYTGAHLCGTAVTILAQPGDNWMLHVAAEQLRPGDIAVIGCTADNTDGMFGDLLATSYRAQGARGLITDANYWGGAKRSSRPWEWARWKPFQIVLVGGPGLTAA